MKNYIFLTAEGFAFQPNSDSVEPDINNLQVIGFSTGEDSEKAFQKLISENSHLLETTFDEVFACELAKSFKEKKALHYLSKFKQS